jgi:hypothetical protein
LYPALPGTVWFKKLNRSEKVSLYLKILLLVTFSM